MCQESQIYSSGTHVLTPDGFDSPGFLESERPLSIASVFRSREYWVQTYLAAGSYVIRRQSDTRGLIRRTLFSGSRSSLSVVQSFVAVPKAGLPAYAECDAQYRIEHAHWLRKALLGRTASPLLPALGCVMMPILVLWLVVRAVTWILRLITGCAMIVYTQTRRLFLGREVAEYAYSERGIYQSVDHGFSLWKSWTELSPRAKAKFFGHFKERGSQELMQGAVQRAADQLVALNRLSEAEFVRTYAM
jgi:hypothetical protein